MSSVLPIFFVLTLLLKEEIQKEAKGAGKPEALNGKHLPKSSTLPTT